MKRTLAILTLVGATAAAAASVLHRLLEQEQPREDAGIRLQIDEAMEEFRRQFGT